ncbi:MAG: SpoIIE family protein phosphatase, partial [Candidatus Eisenbacteria bacterium]|nr:SpoIIE family protein phosphatase [Candidatus Eisenbacteria bacterium]
PDSQASEGRENAAPDAAPEVTPNADPDLTHDAAPPFRRSVLVVDDEPGLRYTARRILEPGYEVIDAKSGEEALDRLGERSFHIALVDVRLPGLSGLELLAAIKVLSPSTDVVIMTGSAKDPDEALLGSIRRKAFFFLQKPFSAAVLRTLVDRIAETQVLEERVKQHAARLEEDLESARIFQRALIPSLPWKGDRIVIDGIYVGCEQLSGDLIDCFSLPSGGGSLLLAADIMGHGASAAMMTGMVKGQFRAAAAQHADPEALLRAADEVLHGFQLQRFLTALVVLDDPEGGTVRYAGAGHPPGFLRLPGGKVERLESDGPPLNLHLPDPIERCGRILPREPGSRLLLWTDGLGDALSPSGERFQETPEFASAIEAALACDNPSAARAEIEAALFAHTAHRAQEDDWAFLIAALE